jgi:hypothetical protein
LQGYDGAHEKGYNGYYSYRIEAKKNHFMHCLFIIDIRFFGFGKNLFEKQKITT